MKEVLFRTTESVCHSNSTRNTRNRELNCPINKYPEIEEFLESTAQSVIENVSRRDEEDAEERKQYEQVESSVDYNSGPP